MVGFDPNIATYQLQVDADFVLVCQIRRKFASDKNQIINKEVQRLLANGLIR